MLNKLERKFEKYAIKNLMYYLILMYILGFIIIVTMPDIYFKYMALDYNAIFSGQVWRLFTFLIFPTDINILLMFISLIVYYYLGKTIEAAIGTFRFNIFIFSGIILIWIVSLVSYLINGIMPMFIGTRFLNLSILMLLVLLNPETTFLFYFVLPLKAKYLALIEGIYFVVALIRPGASRVEALAAIINLIFITYILKSSNRGFMYGTKKVKKMNNNIDFEKALKKIPKHKCSVCGITDLDDPNMEFRYCSKCTGMKEYCINHINNHEHK